MTLELSFVQVEFPAQIDLARALFRQYQAAVGVDLCFQSFEGELAALPLPYAPPRGSLLLVLRGNEVTGCGAFRPWSADSCELKRMFVRPAFRGSGIGRRLTAALLSRARAAGYRTVRLDTFDFMREATALYKSLGFRQIDRYYDNPHPSALFFELPLC